VTEVAQLRAASGNVQDDGVPLACELATGHDGSHIALAASSEGDSLWWWLCWGSRARQVRQIELCDGRDLDDPYLDECLLPREHPGLHSYQAQGG